MLAILGGLGAALCWATSSMASARSSRLIGSWATLGWVMLIGALIAVPATIVGGAGADLTPTALELLAISAVGNIVGLLLAYTAFQGGKVAVIAPILSTEGAMGALHLDRLRRADRDRGRARPHRDRGRHRPRLGGQPERGRGGGAGRPRGPARRAGAERAGPGQPTRRSTLLALGGVVFFGMNLYASARIGATLPLVWSILPARLGGVLFVALPLLATGRLRLTREAVPFVVVVALAEVVGTPRLRVRRSRRNRGRGGHDLPVRRDRRGRVGRRCSASGCAGSRSPGSCSSRPGSRVARIAAGLTAGRALIRRPSYTPAS